MLLFYFWRINMNTTTNNQIQTIVEKMPSLKDGACLMAVQVTGSCGESTLTGSAALLDGETLESSLIKGTSIQWFPKEQLRFVNKTLQRVNRLFSQHGVAFGKGLTLVPLSKSDEVQAKLDQLKAEFNDAVDCIVNGFDEALEEHKKVNADIAHLIDRFKLDAEQFRGRFAFKAIPPMAVQPLFEEDEEALRESITQTLWEEIAEDAAKLAKGTFIAKEQCSQKAVSAVKKLKAKLTNLAFLDEGIFKVVESFDEALNDLPTSGPIEGGYFHRLANYVQTISQESNLRAIAAGEFEAIVEVEEEETTVEEEIPVAISSSVISTPQEVIDPITVFGDELDFGGF